MDEKGRELEDQTVRGRKEGGKWWIQGVTSKAKDRLIGQIKTNRVDASYNIYIHIKVN